MRQILFVLAALALAAPAHAPDAAATATEVCAACHGADGNSVAAANPSLAGQHADYSVKQLTEFKSGARKNPIMMGMAAPLSPEDMKNVGAYFAEQKIKPREAADKKLLPEGQKIFKGGVASTKIPACMACHGPNGAGIPAQYPRLGGQHAGYIVAQMTAFRSGERANNTVMRDIALKMTDAQIKAVAEYISGLR